MPGMCKVQHRGQVARAGWARGKMEGDEVREGMDRPCRISLALWNVWGFVHHEVEALEGFLVQEDGLFGFNRIPWLLDRRRRR